MRLPPIRLSAGTTAFLSLIIILFSYGAVSFMETNDSIEEEKRELVKHGFVCWKARRKDVWIELPEAVYLCWNRWTDEVKILSASNKLRTWEIILTEYPSELYGDPGKRPMPPEIKSWTVVPVPNTQ